MSNWFATSNLAVIVSLPVTIMQSLTVSVSLCFEFGVRDATRENLHLQETKLSQVHRLDRHTNNVQLHYDAEYNLNYCFEIESCCNLTVSVSLCFDEIEVVISRGIPEICMWRKREASVSCLTHAGGFGFSHSEMSNRNASRTDSLID